MKIRNRPKAILVGPFVGELSWEYYRFAPYVIHKKKEFPNAPFIVCTRQERFDLYGGYASIFVPLKIHKDEQFVRSGFSLAGLSGKNYEIIKTRFFDKYSERFNIIEHIFPKVHKWYGKIKWQFPRDDMDYDFKTRSLNKKIVYDFIKKVAKKKIYIYVDSEFDGDIEKKYITETNYIPIFRDMFFDSLPGELVRKNEITTLGCLIELLKRCYFVVSNLDNDSGRLAMLLKKAVISIDKNVTSDEIHLLNPFNVPYICCDDIIEGIHYYENNF
jgi:hypothetical protein